MRLKGNIISLILLEVIINIALFSEKISTFQDNGFSKMCANKFNLYLSLNNNFISQHYSLFER